MQMHETEAVCAFVSAHLSPTRMAHTDRVLKMAREMADAFDCADFRIDRDALTVAALYHDRAKEMPQEAQIALLAESDGAYRAELAARFGAVAHGYTAAVLLPLEFPSLASEATVDAIRYHTTGRVAMSPLEIVLFLSDYAEEGRTPSDCIRARDMIRNAYEQADAYDRLLKVLAFVLERTIAYLEEKKRDVHPDTRRALAYYMTKIAKA